MKFCTHCGNKLEENAKFCSHCGNNLSEEPNSQQNQNSNEPLYKQYMGNQAQPVQNTPPTAPAKKKSPVVFILIALGIVALIVLTFTMCNIMGNNDDNSFDSDYSGVSNSDVTLNDPLVAPSTIGEENALETAYDYLNALAFSHEGLIDQLEYEGYSYSEAKYAADNCGADWYQQAYLMALDYLDSMAFSYEGLLDQLEYEGFTYDQAVYGVDHCGADWYEEAARMAAEYLDSMSFSRSELIGQLEYEGFTYSQAEYGVDAVGY